MIEYLIALAVAVYLLTRAPRREPALKTFMFDENAQPYVLLVKRDTPSYERMASSVKRICHEMGVPFEEVPPERSPYPIKSPAVVFQGRYLWFTPSTYNKDLFVKNLSIAVSKYKQYLALRENRVRKSVALLHPGPFARYRPNPSSYLSQAFVSGEDIAVAPDGYHITGIPVPYTPWLEEYLNSVGGGVFDMRDLKPYSEHVLIERPKLVKEVV